MTDYNKAFQLNSADEMRNKFKDQCFYCNSKNVSISYDGCTQAYCNTCKKYLWQGATTTVKKQYCDRYSDRYFKLSK